MGDPRLQFVADLSALDADEWVHAVEDLAEDHGSFTQLGPHHMAAFLDAGRTLLVTFEAIPQVRDRADGLPSGFDYARTDGWSVLALLSTGDSWFREELIYRYIDRLIDDGFFEDFDSVLFFGAGAGGYAAAAYSVASPGARVLALQPQATLDPGIAGWDPRHFRHRSNNFTDRYGYAPDMIDAARHAYIVYCPQQTLDAMHAALFTRPNVTMLRADGLADLLPRSFTALRIMDDLMRHAMDGTLTPARFGALIKIRKRSPFYLRRLVLRLLDGGHDQLAAMVCRIALARGRNPFFEKHLAALDDAPRSLLTEDAG
ncbi:phosphoadenosine phosphosulfate reductase [Salipiger sp. IMCC34102]|uniref:phosphoadenosine phosphosulfate reductase n=1 Tax=Salipiger sp. IMCC34102 TaxID=2510647 RepID=UPI00101D0F3E|nr:phosphoadenosine phosphosulfate reductase [Salipiger sp. IMCC34102]RYH02799.1 phosphoadenosine phosphosulfate reductase [Salipiger sp. IMCC34102]